MNRRFFYSIFIIGLAVAAMTIIHFQLGVLHTASQLPSPPDTPPAKTVILIPLDSRPPCTQYVQQLAMLVNIKVIIPPPELLDYYKTPANKTALALWLKDAAKNADAAIVSTDMLIHGGLLSSRLGIGTPQDTEQALKLLTELHQTYPDLKIYAFHIIPRLLIADNEANFVYQQKMLKYSVLKDKILTFENPSDIKTLNALEKEIPPEVIQKYLTLNDATAAEGMQLIDMTEKGILNGLIIGQDDGQPFGLPTMVKNRLVNYLDHNPGLADRVFITRGTDEVALTMLGHMVFQNGSFHPKIYTEYSHPDAPSIVMPFMPHSVERTVREKLGIAAAIPTSTLDDSDIVLYVHIGTRKTRGAVLTTAARRVKSLIESGRPVALVDLSEDYYGHETLLPYLIKENVPIGKLIAYAGWNTTSNSIGTAVTQATLFSLRLNETNSATDRLKLYQYNLDFLVSRFLDDWYFQKEVQPYVNARLKDAKVDVYNLNDNYDQVNNWIKRLMNERAYALLQQALFDKHITVDSDSGPFDIWITSLTVETALPWPRTFEIRLNPTLTIHANREIK
jgi:hypothetical protein